MSILKQTYESFEKAGTATSPAEVDYRKLFDAGTQLIEALNFSKPQEIYELLQTKNEEDPLLLPFWFRTTAFRILVSKAPGERNYIEAAIDDLKLFGPLYDPATAEYEAMQRNL